MWWIVATIGVLFVLDVVIVTPIIRRAESERDGLP